MGKYALAWLAFVMFANDTGAAEYLSDANYFGAFTTENQAGNSGCASLDAKAVTAGMPVNIVVLSKPQRLLQGTVRAEASTGCTRYFQASESAAFYEVGIAGGKFEPHEIGILVLPGATLTKIKGGDVIAQFGQKQYRFFECASSEGIHIGVRFANGKRQIAWHDYIYVGIDVEPTCSKSDYVGIDMLGKAFRRGPGIHTR
jgi:hypothetical protein